MIDATHQITAVDRQVGSRTLPAGEARVVTLGQAYPDPIEDVWDACTNPERIPRWFMPISGDLQVGGHYQLEGNAGGTVERCDPPKGFAATWEFGGEVSWVEVRLSPTPEGGTYFELEHIAHVDDERWGEFGPGAVGVGWDLGLLGLATHLATGAAVAPDEGAQFAASDEGRRFATQASDLWYEAAVAGGEDATAARAAADRTTAAYVPPQD